MSSTDFKEYIQDAPNNEEAGNEAPEDISEEPEFENELFNAIIDTSINILKTEAVQEMFDELKKELSPQCTGTLVKLLTVVMSQSAYHAIMFHDELLRMELIKQFDSLIHHINLNKQDIGEMKSHIQVANKKISMLHEHLQIAEMDGILN